MTRRRVRKALVALSCGGVTFGWLQAFGMVPFSDVLTSIVITVLSLFVTILFGGDPSELLQRFQLR